MFLISWGWSCGRHCQWPYLKRINNKVSGPPTLLKNNRGPKHLFQIFIFYPRGQGRFSTLGNNLRLGLLKYFIVSGA